MNNPLISPGIGVFLGMIIFFLLLIITPLILLIVHNKKKKKDNDKLKKMPQVRQRGVWQLLY